MKCKAYLLNWLRHQGGGGTPLALQDDKAVTITTNTTTTIEPDEGYDGLKSVEVTTNVVGDYNTKVNTKPSDRNGNDSLVINVLELPEFDFANYTSIQSFFSGCYKITTAPQLKNTSQVTSMLGLFNNCQSLVNVPVYDVSSVTTMAMMFFHCYELSNDSLNNILYMCSHVASNYTANKTLANIGLDSTQATTCTGLPNWSACVSAGWTTGY